MSKLNNTQILATLGYNMKDFYSEDDNWIFSKKEHLCYEDYNKKIYGPDIKVNYDYCYDEEYDEHIYFIELHNFNQIINKTIRVISKESRYEKTKNNKFFENDIIIFMK